MISSNTCCASEISSRFLFVPAMMHDKIWRGKAVILCPYRKEWSRCKRKSRRVASRRVCLRALELRRVTSPSFLTSMYLTFGSLLDNSVHQSSMLPTVTPPEALQGLPEDQAHVAIRVSQMYRTAADASSYTSLGGAEGWLICWSHFCPCRMCVISWE